MRKKFVFLFLWVALGAKAETQIWKSVDPETGHIIFSSQPKGNKAAIFKTRNAPKLSVSEARQTVENTSQTKMGSSESWDVTQEETKEIKNNRPAISASGVPPPMALPPLPKK